MSLNFVSFCYQPIFQSTQGKWCHKKPKYSKAATKRGTVTIPVVNHNVGYPLTETIRKNGQKKQKNWWNHTSILPCQTLYQVGKNKANNNAINPVPMKVIARHMTISVVNSCCNDFSNKYRITKTFKWSDVILQHPFIYFSLMNNRISLWTKGKTESISVKDVLNYW